MENNTCVFFFLFVLGFWLGLVDFDKNQCQIFVHFLSLFSSNHDDEIDWSCFAGETEHEGNPDENSMGELKNRLSPAESADVSGVTGLAQGPSVGTCTQV